MPFENRVQFRMEELRGHFLRAYLDHVPDELAGRFMTYERFEPEQRPTRVERYLVHIPEYSAAILFPYSYGIMFLISMEYASKILREKGDDWSRGTAKYLLSNTYPVDIIRHRDGSAKIEIPRSVASKWGLDERKGRVVKA